jgi:hypothetical protein
VHRQNNQQTRLFSHLEALTQQGPAIELTRRQQNELLSVQAEFALVREVRDLVDELTMVRHVYDAQLALLDPLFDMQYSDALFHAGLTDLFGNLLRPSDAETGSTSTSTTTASDASNTSGSVQGVGGEGDGVAMSPDTSFGPGVGVGVGLGVVAPGAAEGSGPSDAVSRPKGKGERQREREELRQAMAVPIRWDERGWFNRTAQYMRRHREMIQGMMDDTEKVYTAVWVPVAPSLHCALSSPPTKC